MYWKIKNMIIIQNGIGIRKLFTYQFILKLKIGGINLIPHILNLFINSHRKVSLDPRKKPSEIKK